MTNNRYEPELKQKVLRLYLEEGRTKKSLTEEYNLGQGTLTYWLQQYRKKENDFLKKAAAFFAKEIDQLSTSSSRNINRHLGSDGFLEE